MTKAEVTGIVVEFDEHVGLGTVRSDDTAEEVFFHCTSISDGSRSIDPGTKVSYSVVAARKNLIQAIDVTKL